MMKGPRAVALAVVVLCAPVAAGGSPPLAKNHNKAKALKVALASPAAYASPDGRHAARVTSRGEIQLDGRPIRCGSGKLQGAVVWRHDSRALAFLQRSRHGLELVVVPRLDSASPLTWRLPPLASSLSKIFWVGKTRVGVGAKPLVPRLVVSWRTRVLPGSRHLY
jgi:hypothetical protein